MDKSKSRSRKIAYIYQANKYIYFKVCPGDLELNLRLLVLDKGTLGEAGERAGKVTRIKHRTISSVKSGKK